MMEKWDKFKQESELKEKKQLLLDCCVKMVAKINVGPIEKETEEFMDNSY